jgi:hypothetical protein
MATVKYNLEDNWMMIGLKNRNFVVYHQQDVRPYNETVRRALTTPLVTPVYLGQGPLKGVVTITKELLQRATKCRSNALSTIQAHYPADVFMASLLAGIVPANMSSPPQTKPASDPNGKCNSNNGARDS